MNTITFSKETPFSDIAIGDIVVVVDKTGNPMKGKVTSKNTKSGLPGFFAIKNGDCMMFLDENDRVWVCKELRIHLSNSIHPFQKPFAIYDKNDFSYLSVKSYAIFSRSISKVASFDSYDETISYLQDTFISFYWDRFDIIFLCNPSVHLP